MTARVRERLTVWRALFFAIVAAGATATVLRFTQGLGAVTNMSDAYPWGLWKVFGVLCGVGLGGAGFTLTATVYLFHARRYYPIVRPAVLMAFLGYMMAVAALVFDLGRPWTIWHPLVMWNHHSVLFEVAWCVMLYSTVLALEGSGMVFERLGWKTAVKVQHAVVIPIVVAGVMLSTLHQSSLGSLFLIVPGKLHPLWYSSWIPMIFFVSAIAAGISMVILGSCLSARALGRRLELPVISDLGRVLLAVLGVYGVIRTFDLVRRGAAPLAFQPTYEAAMFQVEILLGFAIPFVLLAIPRVRANSRGLYAASALSALGFVMNRMNVGLTGFEAAQGGHYFPAAGELAITLMLVALPFAAFRWAVRQLPVYARGPESGAGAASGPLAAGALAADPILPRAPARAAG